MRWIASRPSGPLVGTLPCRRYPYEVCLGGSDGPAAAVGAQRSHGSSPATLRLGHLARAFSLLKGARAAQSTLGLHHQVSTDSNHFGSVGVESVQARVAAKLWPLSEAGFVR